MDTQEVVGTQMSYEFKAGMMRASELLSKLARERMVAAELISDIDDRIAAKGEALGIGEAALAILTELETKTETEAQS